MYSNVVTAIDKILRSYYVSTITSLLVHSMRCTSMPRGSSFPFHPTTTALFRYSLTSLVTTPSADSTSCPHSTSRRIGFSHALCLGHRRAPFSSLIFLPFLIGFIVLLVRDVGTLGVVAWPCFLTPRTLDLTMPRVPCLVRASCFHLSTPLFLGQIILLSPTSTFISHTF